MSAELEVLPARSGRAVFLRAGMSIEIINTHGAQVVDTWALCPGGELEWLSMEHTRAVLHRLIPRVGDQLVTNTRRPMLTLLEDSSPGCHDTLIPACDRHRYRLLGATGYHDNCQDNFRRALEPHGISVAAVPSPLNLFMNIPWTPDGALSFDPPRSRPGDLVRLRAEVDLLFVMSACPQDMIPINGVDQAPTEVHFRVRA